MHPVQAYALWNRCDLYMQVLKSYLRRTNHRMAQSLLKPKTRWIAEIERLGGRWYDSPVRDDRHFQMLSNRLDSEMRSLLAGVGSWRLPGDAIFTQVANSLDCSHLKNRPEKFYLAKLYPHLGRWALSRRKRRSAAVICVSVQSRFSGFSDRIIVCHS